MGAAGVATAATAVAFLAASAAVSETQVLNPAVSEARDARF
jgi:hypothetical protein